MDFIRRINTVDASLMIQIVPVPRGIKLSNDQINFLAIRNVLVGEVTGSDGPRQILVSFKEFLDFLGPYGFKKKGESLFKRNVEAGVCPPNRAYLRWAAFLNTKIKIRMDGQKTVGCLAFTHVTPKVRNKEKALELKCDAFLYDFAEKYGGKMGAKNPLGYYFGSKNFRDMESKRNERVEPRKAKQPPKAWTLWKISSLTLKDVDPETAPPFAP